MSLKDDLIRDEGIILHAYQDTEGYWTIGVGHLIDDRLGGTIPYEIAMKLLDYDIAQTETELTIAFPWYEDLTEDRKDALCNMHFQLGMTRLRGFKKMLAALERGDYQTASREALDSKWAWQTHERAKRVAEKLK